MTDLPPDNPLLDPDEADLLASLYVDGEATDEERAAVEADPRLMRRVEEFRRLSRDLAAPVAAPSVLATMQITAALDEFDRVTAERAPADVAPVVASLSERRARRRGPPAWIGAAAVAALIVGGLGVVATQGGDDNDEAAATDSTATAASSNADRATDGGAAELSAEADVAEAAPSGADVADGEDAAEAEVAEEEAGTADAGDGANDEAMDTTAPLDAEQAAAFYEANGPIDLDGIDAATAADLFEQLGDVPLQSIGASPCSQSALVEGLSDVDSFVPVVFQGQVSSLVLQAGDPSTATIIGPTCEVELG